LEDEIQEEFDAYVAERNSCAVTDDCVIAIADCPLGCAVAVNRVHQADVESKAHELVADYDRGGQTCEYRCAPTVAVCTEGRCEEQPL